jgi:hypothetical protein
VKFIFFVIVMLFEILGAVVYPDGQHLRRGTVFYDLYDHSDDGMAVVYPSLLMFIVVAVFYAIIGGIFVNYPVHRVGSQSS